MCRSVVVILITPCSDSIVKLTVVSLLNKNQRCPFNTNILLFFYLECGVAGIEVK